MTIRETVSTRGWRHMLIGAMVMLLPSPALAANHIVAPGSEVSFVAKITASSFVAKSTGLSGVVDFDAAAGLIRTASIKVKADSFDTGMSLRNSHMRDNYLEAGKFPEIVFETTNAAASAAAGSEIPLEGTFTIKGVKKPIKLAAKVVESTGGKLVVTTTFKLNITDYGIPQPKFTVVKMETVIEVTLKLVLEAKG